VTTSGGTRPGPAVLLTPRGAWADNKWRAPAGTFAAHRTNERRNLSIRTCKRPKIGNPRSIRPKTSPRSEVASVGQWRPKGRSFPRSDRRPGLATGEDHRPPPGDPRRTGQACPPARRRPSCQARNRPRDPAVRPRPARRSARAVPASGQTRPPGDQPGVFEKQYLGADDTGPYVASDDLAGLIEPLVNHARNESGTALIDGAAVGSGKNPLVEVLSAYLNPTEHVRRLRDVIRKTEHR
jgi:hypothetical protein